MKSDLPEPESEDILPGYDFETAVRGKHADGYRQGYKTTIRKVDGSIEEHDFTLPEGVVKPDPDVRAYFPDNESVNRALRGLIDLIPDRNSTEKVQ